jgi:hypothetical protein
VTKLAAAKSKADELRKVLRELDKVTGKASERDDHADRMRAKRQSERIVTVPELTPEQKAHRTSLEANDCAWLRHFFPVLFWYDWQPQQREMIEAIRHAIIEADDQAIAASRGEGKTKIAERLLLKYSLQGIIKLSVLFAATGSHAEDSLRSIMAECEENELLNSLYPEVCAPVRALENTPNRAHYQKCNGFRHDTGEPYEAATSRFSWCGKEIILPRLPGSPASGAIIATRGLDAAVRGLNKLNRRVDVAIIDDPDTEESARSEGQADKLMKRIDRAIGGLGGQQKGVGRVVITTLQSRIAVSYLLTDSVLKPSMKGKRFSFMLRRPDRMDLWEEYIRLRKQDWENERNSTRSTLALDFYKANYDVMNVGADVANPHRHYAGQLSAIQFYFDEWARKDEGYVLTELDNNPPEDSGRIESGITPQLVQRQLSGVKHRIIPDGCTVLVHASDVGKTKGFHWVVRAFKPDGTGYTIDYGIMDVPGVKYGSNVGLNVAIYNAVLRREAQFREAGYCTASGETIAETASIYDSRYENDAVMRAVKQLGIGVWAIKGIGTSAGAEIKGKFRPCTKATETRKPGSSERWYFDRDNPFRLWAVHADTDYWKAWEHARWMTATDKPGCMFLWGDGDTPQRQHDVYARHICSDIEVEEEHKGVMRRVFLPKQTEMDWLDASYYADVAASMKGIRIMATQKVSQPRLTLAEMAAKARAG